MMLSRRLIVCGLTLLLVISQSACVESVNPVADPKSCSVDDDLVGQWKWTNGDQTAYLFIGRARGIENRPDGLMVIQEVAINQEREVEWGETPTYFFPIKVGEYRYWELVRLDSRKLTKWEPAAAKSYQLMKYELTGGKLAFWLMDKAAVMKAIKDGRLKGTIEQKEGLLGPVITLTETTEALRRLLATNQGASLFSDRMKVTLKRVE